MHEVRAVPVDGRALLGGMPDGGDPQRDDALRESQRVSNEFRPPGVRVVAEPDGPEAEGVGRQQ